MGVKLFEFFKVFLSILLILNPKSIDFITYRQDEDFLTFIKIMQRERTHIT